MRAAGGNEKRVLERALRATCRKKPAAGGLIPARRGQFIPTASPFRVLLLPANTHPLKVGLMHLSKYFSYAIDVNAVIK